MIVYGKQIFRYLLERHPQRIRQVFVSKDLDGADFAKLRRLGIPVVRVDNKKAQAMARGGNHQGVLIEIEPPVLAEVDDLKEGRFLVMLYGVTDVGNIGSIVRTAYALGADGLIAGGIKSFPFEGVVRTSSGAALDLPIALAPNALDAAAKLKDVGHSLYGADMSGEDVRKERFAGRRTIILGSEGEGIAPRLLAKCDKTLRIEMEREFDSLNVSAAAAIFIDRMRDG